MPRRPKEGTLAWHILQNPLLSRRALSAKLQARIKPGSFRETRRRLRIAGHTIPNFKKTPALGIDGRPAKRAARIRQDLLDGKPPKEIMMNENVTAGTMARVKSLARKKHPEIPAQGQYSRIDPATGKPELKADRIIQLVLLGTPSKRIAEIEHTTVNAIVVLKTRRRKMGFVFPGDKQGR